MNLTGKCALVTGSVAGLGQAVAASLAEAGANVVIHGLGQEAQEGRAAAERLAGAHGVETAFSATDLRDTAAIEAMAAEIIARFAGIDILVNNAVMRHFSPAEALSPEAWNASIAVNLSSAFHLARLALPGMKARNWGRIVNMSSIYGSRGAENRIDYVTTKTALLGMTRALAIELARTGITCNAVCPGTVPSPAIVDRITKLAEDSGVPRPQVEHDYLAARNPSGRFVAPEGVGALVVFLCTDHGRDITGATLPIDGGWLAG